MPSPRGGSSIGSPSPCPPQGAGVHWKPLPMPSPRGGSSFLLCLRWLRGAPSPWGRLGWGLWCCSFPLGKVGMGPLCRDGACCLRHGCYYVSSPLFFASVRGDDINTKSRVVDGGFALAWTVAPTVGKRVFLRVVSTIPTVMRCMTPSSATVKKAAYGRSKSPAFAGTKTAANRGPSPNPPQGAGVPRGSSFLGFLEGRRYKPIIYYVPYPFRLPHV